MNAHPRLSPAAALAAALLFFSPATPVRAAVPGGQPVYESAPRSARIWHPADPYGYAQLKWIAGTFIPYMGAADDTLAAGYTALSARCDALVASNAVLSARCDALAASNAVLVVALEEALDPVPSFPLGDILFSDGTNLFYVSADRAYTNALTTNVTPE